MKGRECRGDREGGKINIQVETMLKLKTTGGGGDKENDERGKGEAGGGSCLFGWP